MPQFAPRFRSLIKRFIPDQLQALRIRWIEAGVRKRYARLSVGQAFSRIYRTKAWGATEGERFCSGFGSDPQFAEPYVTWVSRFIVEQNIRQVVDLGCGDFRVGRWICAAGGLSQYTGVDVVEDLIAHNQSRFGRGAIAFRVADIIRDELPDGELCLIRQVFQHLSIAQISQVLERCKKKYKFVVITEEIYVGAGCRPNLDKPHGPDTRVYDRSGVYLDCSPFSVCNTAVLELPVSKRSVLRTSLVTPDCLTQKSYSRELRVAG